MSRDPKDWNGDIIAILKNGSIVIYNSISKIIKYKNNPSHNFEVGDVKLSNDYIATCSQRGDVMIHSI